jgi:hypothetical protein
MPEGPLDLYDLAYAYLLDCADALDTIPDAGLAHTPPVDLEGAPERMFVSPGIPVNDFVGPDCCTQLAVRVEPIQEQATTPDGLDAGLRAGSRYAWVNQVTLIATISRCIPSGENAVSGFVPPSPDELNLASMQHTADSWALWNHLHNLVRAEHLVSLCEQVFFDGLIPAVPAGGCAGWSAVIRVALEGYEELIGS